MIKYLGLDLGKRRIGLAISDDLNITAQVLDFIDFKDLTSFVNDIIQLVAEKGVTRFIIGNPRNMKGTESAGSLRAKEIAERLKDETGIDAVLWDERLTTVSAEKILISANVRRKKRKQKIDSLAAQVMLQSYLDYV
ncbi:MAG: Holliday junction resolvase RuvX, partial [Candidatus Aureabacteria bacterium]|nr:Holliday junction resolvase RuvX [Candidatus Auribacterota bacterium]